MQNYALFCEKLWLCWIYLAPLACCRLRDVHFSSRSQSVSLLGVKQGGTRIRERFGMNKDQGKLGTQKYGSNHGVDMWNLCILPSGGHDKRVHVGAGGSPTRRPGLQISAGQITYNWTGPPRHASPPPIRAGIDVT